MGRWGRWDVVGGLVVGEKLRQDGIGFDLFLSILGARGIVGCSLG